MKSKTKRKFDKFLWLYLTVIGLVFAVGGIFKPPLVSFQDRLYFIASMALISWGIIYTCEKLLTPKVVYFEQVDFRKRDKATIGEAIEGILNFEKAEPFYVHAAPKFDEVPAIVSKLEDSGVVAISAESGAGKSMAAYQAAYMLQKERRWRVYQLKTAEVENKTGGEILSQVVSVSELDNLKGKRRLILIDDAHKLPNREDLRAELEKEAKESNGKYIWVETEEETEEEFERTRLDAYGINLQNSLDSLLKGFYQSEEPSLQRALAGRTKGLQGAIKGVNEGKISDVWHFTFCATQGWERLVDKVKSLEDVEATVLFFISAHAVLSGECELHINDVIDKIRGLEFGWIAEQKSSSPTRDAIQKLASSELKLIRIYDKGYDKGYIRSLHYNFAREAIKTCLLKESLAKYMLTSAKVLLTSNYRQCVYYGAFHNCIGQYAAEFARDNKDWLIGFLGSPLPEWLHCYPRALTAIGKTAEDVYEQIITELDIAKLAALISVAKSDKFQELANLLNALGDRRDELLRKLDFAVLADTAKTIGAAQFHQLAYLLKVLGDHKDALTEKLDFTTLAETAVTAKVEQFPQLTYLLNILGDYKDKLLNKLDFAALAGIAATAEVKQFHQVQVLLAALGNEKDELDKELVKETNLSKLAQKANAAEIEQLGQLAELLNAMGERRGGLIERLDLTQLAKVATGAEVGQFQQLAELLNAMGERRRELIERLDLTQLAKVATAAEVGQFDQLSHLLDALGGHRDELLKDDNFDLSKLAQKANAVEIEQFGQMEALSIALGSERGKLIKELVKEPNLSNLAQKANAAEIEQFDQITKLLSALGNRQAKLLEKLDLPGLAKAASVAEIRQFSQLAQLLNTLGEYQSELIEKLNLAELATRTSSAKVEQFQQIAFLLNALGERSDLFVDQLVADDQKILKSLAEKASCIPPNRFPDIAGLLNSLGPRKTHLIALLDYKKLTETAGEIGPYDISGLTLFTAQLDEEHRDPFIRKVNWRSICVTCPIYVVLLQAFGASLENLCKQAEMLSDLTGVNTVANHLRDHAHKIKQEITRAHPNQYKGVAKFLWNCNQVDHSLAFEIGAETMDKLVAGFSIGPANYGGVGQLMNALYEIDPHLSASFINNEKVRGKIQQSINRGGWGENMEHLKHLIKAFYRSAPDLWWRMVNSGWIVVDLRSLDLDSIYREVDERKNVDTAYDTP